MWRDELAAWLYKQKVCISTLSWFILEIGRKMLGLNFRLELWCTLYAGTGNKTPEPRKQPEQSNTYKHLEHVSEIPANFVCTCTI